MLKKFPVHIGVSTDFSGYDRENWVLHSKEQHIHDVKEIMEEVTKSGKQSAESQYCLRYSVLLSLPYFDPIKFTAIDVIHA